MKKTLLITLLSAFATFYAQAQYALPVGGKQLNAGVGFSSWGIPVYVGMDFGIHKDISIGGELSFRSRSDNFNGNRGYYDFNDNKYRDYRFDYLVFGFAFNGNYHFNYLLKIPKEWDFYAGANVGVYFVSASSTYSTIPASSYAGVGAGIQVGGRYYFNEKFGLNLEFGGGFPQSGGKFGITYKF